LYELRRPYAHTQPNDVVGIQTVLAEAVEGGAAYDPLKFPYRHQGVGEEHGDKALPFRALGLGDITN
tara:strand:+ start:1813 stop:2013 length:201 start_codon:yes stop_codon:yes gene_type:complete